MTRRAPGDGDAPIPVVFDTRCVLCSRWVRFLLRHEADARLHFVGAWSPAGAAVAARHGLGAADLQRSYLVVVDGVPLVRSDASLALLARLKAPWRWLGVLKLVLRPIRDAVYDRVARDRYRWFGEAEACIVPGPGLRDRFTLD